MSLKLCFSKMSIASKPCTAKVMSALSDAGSERAICLRASGESSQMRTGKDMPPPYLFYQ
ncbi:Uncharacterised protein [Vibrio cholerae]|uniref:Uncharacterized protein n=1 Tax=Vibrio cholerae TaxID=666 RepID=A0A655PW14_VIBCL|nr:Uncharacterised protein [Vibrio cholerae]